jgi:WD40 repeat protein
VKIWKIRHVDQATDLVLLSTISPFAGVAVTAIDATFQKRTMLTKEDPSGVPVSGWLLVMGAEDGNIQIWIMPCEGSDTMTPIHVHSVPSDQIHGATVSKIKWKESSLQSELKFASVGEDHSVRVFRCLGLV